ncbi:TIR domain-containing protein [Streptomyces sp. LHD-70]|uniref:toll/interleukin-1 receptor domain-containing protein n=1 Tax=Streptomyces sp. LHD-70 TaxID=3072140 RepID=UPI00280E5F1F|nr:TIR domain-containing protein [Streptomyces sp. LHD-70]MDQ8707157.1 TIR domain-containing protein [Streptomyces sp. LHD-70]
MKRLRFPARFQRRPRVRKHIQLRRIGPAFSWLRSLKARRRRPGRIRTELGYGVFLSYSGDRDRRWLPHLQRAIEKQSRPWYKPPRIRAFLDASGVSIGPQLWGKIESGLARSEWLVVMASPESRDSSWVDREIEWWLKHRSVDTILLVVTAGQLVWDEQRGDWDAELSTALPARLSGRFEQQPVWKSVQDLRPDSSGDTGPDVDGIALGIASVVRGLSEDDLKSEGMRDTRRNLRTARIIAGVLALFLLITSTVSVIALVQRAEATRQRDHAVAQQLIGQSSFLATRDPFGARLKALAAWRIDPTPESRLAVLNAAVNPASGLLAHSWPTKSVAYSPDGRTIASGGGDGIVRLWNASTQQKIGDPFIGHNRAITSVAFAPDGKTLASTSLDGTVRLWNVADRTQIGDVLNPRAGMVYSAAFSPDGRTLVTGGEGESGGAVRLWDVTAHRQIGKPPEGRTLAVNSVAFSPDGRTFATGGSAGLQLWDANSRTPLGKRLGTGGYGIGSVSFSKDGRTVAAGDADGGVRLWNTATREALGKPLTAATGAGSVEAVAFSPDRTMLAAAYQDGSVQLWNLSRHRRMGAAFTGHTSTVWAVAFSPDGSTLATASNDTTVRLWDVRTQRQVGPAFDTPSISATALSPDGRTLAVAESNQAVRFWNVAARRQIGEPLIYGDPGFSSPISFSPDSTVLATAPRHGAGTSVQLRDVRTRRQVGRSMHEQTGYGGNILAISFTRDGRILATAGEDSVRLWNVETQRQIGKALDTRSTILAFSPDSRTLATTAEGNTVMLWDVATHRRTGGTRPGHTAQINAVTFSPDGTMFATASRDNTVRLWNAGTRKQIGEPLTGHRSGVNSLAFSPDGATLVTAGMDRTVRLWDVATRRPIGEPLEGHSDTVTGVAFGADGRTIASWSNDRTVRLWDVDASVDPVHSLCAWASGAFTADQWRAYVPPGPAYRPLCPEAGPN